MQQQYLCKIHKKQNLFKCSCEQSFICTSCFDSGKHLNHQVDLIESQDDVNQSNFTMMDSKNSKQEQKDQQNGQIYEVKGDLLSFEADIIVQQCNCITTNEKGLSLSILKKFGVSAYETRIKGKGNIADKSSIDIPGTCKFQKPKIIIKNSQIQYIANLFGQFAPGKTAFKYQNTLCQYIKDPLTNKPIIDTAPYREKWFEQCLKQLSQFAKEKKLYKIAFPCRIGCGLAGGQWENYKKMIQEFSESNKQLKIYIVQLEE